MEEDVKTAWIDKEHKVVAFNAVDESEMVEEKESQFWDLICQMTKEGYRIL